MKLKRIISALLVFTMVMACSVCAVSANGTYQVTTSYDVSTKEITVNAKLAGATADSMVSYLIIEPEEVTTGEGEEATTTLNYDVKADGSNILHIDQATANTSGAATYDSATIPFSELENAKVKFVSSASEELAPYEAGRKADGSVSNVGTYTKSVTKFTKLQTGVIVYNQSDSGQTVGMYYVTKDGAVIGTDSRGTNLNATRWQSEGHFDDLFNGDTAFINKGLKQYIPLDDVVAWSLVLGNKDNRESAVQLLFKKVGTSFSGELSTDTGTMKLYNNYNEVMGKEGSNYDLTINGIYKDDVTDGKFGTLNVSGGDVFSVDKTNVPVPYDNKEVGFTRALKAMTIDAKPIYGTFTSYNNGIEYPSVTILVTATDVATADNAGLKIQAVTKGAATVEGAYPAEVEVVDLGICPNAYTGTKNFAIQLFDSANEGYLNPEKYDIVATPVLKVADEWVELSVTGSVTGKVEGDTIADGKYYVVDRDTVATEDVAE